MKMRYLARKSPLKSACASLNWPTAARWGGGGVTSGMVNIKGIINLAAWREKSEHTSNRQPGEKFSPFALA